MKYQYSDSTQITPHFNSSEFRCKCGKVHEFGISNELVDKLEKLYAALNCSKIIVTSGYRCPTHGKNVGGSGTGQHTLGNAADICCYGQDGQPISSKKSSVKKRRISASLALPTLPPHISTRMWMSALMVSGTAMKFTATAL